jgi:hypothetical protein
VSSLTKSIEGLVGSPFGNGVGNGSKLSGHTLPIHNDTKLVFRR